MDAICASILIRAEKEILINVFHFDQISTFSIMSPIFGTPLLPNFKVLRICRSVCQQKMRSNWT